MIICHDCGKADEFSMKVWVEYPKSKNLDSLNHALETKSFTLCDICYEKKE